MGGPQLVLGHVKTSTSFFGFQSNVTDFRRPSQQGPKSLSKVTSLFSESGESQEAHQGPWDFVPSGQDLLAVVRQSLYEDRSCVLQQFVSHIQLPSPSPRTLVIRTGFLLVYVYVKLFVRVIVVFIVSVVSCFCLVWLYYH